MKQKSSHWIGYLATAVVSAILSGIITLFCVIVLFIALVGEEGMSMVETMVLVNTLFVGEYDYTEATDNALDTFIDSLGDEWSYYADADYYAAIQESKDNSYVGIGVTISYTTTDLGLYITRVTPGSPAEAGGLLAGEVIVAVDGVSLAGDGMNEGVSMISGPEHTDVTLDILSVDGYTRSVILTRATIIDDPVSYQMLDNQVGLITIQNFNSHCSDQTIAAIDALMAEGAVGLVFDVRNNGGGYLDELLSMLDYILPEGAIFNSCDNFGNSETVYSDEDMIDLPMAVLLNDNSYSAAELFAAELQEWDWAEVVGIQSTGKGYSQQMFPLVHGGAINISTASYTTGQGVSLVGVGLPPDQVVELTEEESYLLLAGTLDPVDDPQVQAAVEAVLEAGS